MSLSFSIVLVTKAQHADKTRITWEVKLIRQLPRVQLSDSMTLSILFVAYCPQPTVTDLMSSYQVKLDLIYI